MGCEQEVAWRMLAMSLFFRFPPLERGKELRTRASLTPAALASLRQQTQLQLRTTQHVDRRQLLSTPSSFATKPSMSLLPVFVSSVFGGALGLHTVSRPSEGRER